MNEVERAAALAIAVARSRGIAELGPDELLLGCLHAISQFGIAQIGPWTFDLEEFAVDWLGEPDHSAGKVAYSERAVEKSSISPRASAAPTHRRPSASITLLAAFAAQADGLMGQWKLDRGITSAAWRAAVAQLAPPRSSPMLRPAETGPPAAAVPRDFLTPEEAADALSIHVQTLRAYVRSGKLPALRLAGERAIRIRREDLQTVLAPLVPQG